MPPLGQREALLDAEAVLLVDDRVAVEYMDYDLAPYPQLHGVFEPYVTALDVLANTGPAAADHVGGRTVPWRDMVARRAAALESTR